MIKATLPAFGSGVVEIKRKSPDPEKTATGIVIDAYSTVAILPYEERTVGVTRYWEAASNDRHIARLIRCPQCKGVDSQCVAVIAGRMYQVIQVQYPDTVMDLSLEVIDNGG